MWERACPAKGGTRCLATASPVFAGQARSHKDPAISGVTGQLQARRLGEVQHAIQRLFTLVGDFDQAIQQLDYAKRRAGGNFPLASQIDQRQREILEQQRMVREMMGR